jgi:Uma2 family endonuclease
VVTLSPRKTYTPDDLLTCEERDLYELDDAGRLLRRAIGAESDEVAYAIAILLGGAIRGKGIGHVIGGGTGLKIFADRPRRLPRGDVVYVSNERLPGGRLPRGHPEVVPDLIAEVGSPGDTAEALESKVREYLGAAVRLVWLVYPESRSVIVRRVDGSVSILSGEDKISGEDVVPGFAHRVSEIFTV